MPFQSRTRLAMVALLAALSLHHFEKGLNYLVVQNPAAGIEDFRHVRVWTAYFIDGVSPQSQNFLYSSRTNPADAAWAVGADPRSPHGEIFTSGVPPWAFPLEIAAFIPGPERAARIYFAALNLFALGALLWLADGLLWRHRGDPVVRALTALSVLAIGANNNVLTQGQNGLLVNAGIVVVLTALERPASRAWAVAAGVGLAFAMIKPSSALLFGLPLLARRRWLSVGVCGAILAAATLFGSWWVQIPVAVQFAQFERATLVVIGQSVNVLMIAVLALAGSPSIARNLMGVLGLGLAVAATLRLARRDALALFAVLAVISRLFTYHRAHDDVLLAFAMIELSRRGFAGKGSGGWQALWAAAGLSLWLPYSLYVARPLQVYQLACWIAACAAIWWYEGKCERGESNPQSLSATGS